jgi:hypothetical protein
MPGFRQTLQKLWASEAGSEQARPWVVETVAFNITAITLTLPASNVRGVYLHDAQFEPIFQAAVDIVQHVDAFFLQFGGENRGAVDVGEGVLHVGENQRAAVA